MQGHRIIATQNNSFRIPIQNLTLFKNNWSQAWNRVAMTLAEPSKIIRLMQNVLLGMSLDNSRVLTSSQGQIGSPSNRGGRGSVPRVILSWGLFLAHAKSKSKSKRQSKRQSAPKSSLTNGFLRPNIIGYMSLLTFPASHRHWFCTCMSRWNTVFATRLTQSHSFIDHFDTIYAGIYVECTFLWPSRFSRHFRLVQSNLKVFHLSGK